MVHSGTIWNDVETVHFDAIWNDVFQFSDEVFIYARPPTPTSLLRVCHASRLELYYKHKI